jgi:hypothetical protein
MNTDLTYNETRDVKRLLGMGHTPDFVAYTIVMSRGVGLTKDIRAQVDEIIKEGEK